MDVPLRGMGGPHWFSVKAHKLGHAMGPPLQPDHHSCRAPLWDQAQHFRSSGTEKKETNLPFQSQGICFFYIMAANIHSLKTHLAPENWPSQKETNLPTVDFQGPIVSSQEGMNMSFE